MNARYGWILVIAVVVGWDVVAVLTDGQSLTSAFRHFAHAHPALRWLLMSVALFLVVHLFEPVSWQRYDPVDRLYLRLYKLQHPASRSRVDDSVTMREPGRSHDD
ncbi:MAG: hypothetical protein E6G06_18070 [Actinobacteria bacterium]|nr:MAG: hypothetical protein E6G06_18070 [Actinomycetota bacterium]